MLQLLLLGQKLKGKARDAELVTLKDLMFMMLPKVLNLLLLSHVQLKFLFLFCCVPFRFKGFTEIQTWIYGYRCCWEENLKMLKLTSTWEEKVVIIKFLGDRYVLLGLQLY